MPTHTATDHTTFDVTLSVDKTGGGTFEELALITSVETPDQSVSVIDRTTLAGTTRRKRPGRYDGGSVSFDLQFDPQDTGHQWLQTALKARLLHPWKISFPNDGADLGGVYSFSGFLTAFQVSATDDDGLLAASASIEVDDDVTFTPNVGS